MQCLSVRRIEPAIVITTSLLLSPRRQEESDNRRDVNRELKIQ